MVAVSTKSAGRLNDRELSAWGGFLRMHARLIAELDRELEDGHGLPLTSYDVLVQLSDAPDRCLRMADLADAVLLSRSGLTRLVDRLEREGLVQRRRCPSDARGTLAVLTQAGLRRLRAAAPTHLEGVRRRFLDELSPAEQRRLADLWTRLTERQAP